MLFISLLLIFISLLFYLFSFFMKITFIFSCSGMFRVPSFIDARPKTGCVRAKIGLTPHQFCSVVVRLTFERHNTDLSLRF